MACVKLGFNKEPTGKSPEEEWEDLSWEEWERTRPREEVIWEDDPNYDWLEEWLEDLDDDTQKRNHQDLMS